MAIFMNNMSREIDTPVSAPNVLPSLKSLTAYALTGGLANGVFHELFVDRAFQTKPDSRALLRTVAVDSAWAFGRGAIRFGVFERTKTLLQRTDTTASLPVWAKGALAGASGGFTENAVQVLRERRLPPAKAVAASTGRTFFGFGTFTYLWASEGVRHEARETVNTEPPRPFWRCWVYAAVAGVVASTIVSGAEGLRGKALLRAVPRGTLMMGTVISVQVTLCADLLVTEPFRP